MIIIASTLDRNGYCPECGRDYHDKDSTPLHCTSDDCPTRASLIGATVTFVSYGETKTGTIEKLGESIAFVHLSTGGVRWCHPESLTLLAVQATQLLIGRASYERGRFLISDILALPKTTRNAIDAYLVSIEHPLAYVPNTQDVRIAEYVRELAGLRK